MNRTLPILCDRERNHEDYVFGKVVGKSRRIQLADIDDEVLKKGWTEDTTAKGVIQSYVVNEQYQWTAEQVGSGWAQFPSLYSLNFG